MPGPPEFCPNCGVKIPRNAKACPECGSDDETGWSDQAHADGLDLPDEEFNYDEFVRKEFASNSRPASGLSWFWWLIAVGVLAGFILFFVL